MTSVARRAQPRSACGGSILAWMITALLLGSTNGWAQISDDVESTIRARLEGQVASWNQGDIDGFMSVYWKSGELSFSSGGRVVRGWQATCDGYKQRYPNRQAMGRLSFSNLEVMPLGDSAALVLGEWKLTRQDDEPAGVFSLVFRKVDGQWVIVHDHTSVKPLSAEEE